MNEWMGGRVVLQGHCVYMSKCSNKRHQPADPMELCLHPTVVSQIWNMFGKPKVGSITNASSINCHCQDGYPAPWWNQTTCWDKTPYWPHCLVWASPHLC